jgi:hypothetical protein
MTIPTMKSPLKFDQSIHEISIIVEISSYFQFCDN